MPTTPSDSSAFCAVSKRLTTHDSKAKALQGELADYWRYRVGHYRLVCEIQDERLLVLVVRIGHRRQVYR